MSKKNIQKNRTQIKLVFGEGKRQFPDFDPKALMEEMGLELNAIAVSSGLILMREIMAREEELLAGKRYEQKTEIDRWGNQPGYVILGGQKVPVERPRLRTKQKKEVVLDSYCCFHQKDERTQAVFQRMLAGVSCRDYPETIERFSEGYGISKSVINREMIQATGKQLDELLKRKFDQFELCVLLIDGIYLGDTVFIVALGVDLTGNKRLLGFREGSTENAEVCKALLNQLVENGLKTDRTILAVLDGAKALRSAVRRVFGSKTPIQRCQLHKVRNVLKHLPDRYHAEFERKMQAAYKMRSYDDAERALKAIIKELTLLNHSAADSLGEGMEETLTLHQLGLPAMLRISLSSTNIIESTFARNRTLMRNVKRWKDSAQKGRWLAATLLHGEKKFRKIKGCTSMPLLVNELAQIKQTEGLDSNDLVA